MKNYNINLKDGTYVGKVENNILDIGKFINISVTDIEDGFYLIKVNDKKTLDIKIIKSENSNIGLSLYIAQCLIENMWKPLF